MTTRRNIDFMVIGAQKAGTTWLDAVFRQHPDILLPQSVKELHYFSRASLHSKGLDWYYRHFDFEKPHKIAGECTPNYLWVQVSPYEKQQSNLIDDIPGTIKAHYPDLKIIVCLREPVDRAVSAYFHHLRNGRIRARCNFQDVLGEFGIVSMGHYADHLEAWFAHFPRDQFEFVIYENDIKIKTNMPATLNRIWSHLGVDPLEAVDTDIVANKREASFVTWLRRQSSLANTAPGQLALRGINTLPLSFLDERFKVRVDPDEIVHLREYYRDHNERLKNLLGIDLPW